MIFVCRNLDKFYRAIFQKESLFVFTMMLNEIFIGYTTWLSSEVFFLNKSYTNFVKKGGDLNSGSQSTISISILLCQRSKHCRKMILKNKWMSH